MAVILWVADNGYFLICFQKITIFVSAKSVFCFLLFTGDIGQGNSHFLQLIYPREFVLKSKYLGTHETFTNLLIVIWMKKLFMNYLINYVQIIFLFRLYFLKCCLLMSFLVLVAFMCASLWSLFFRFDYKFCNVMYQIFPSENASVIKVRLLFNVPVLSI